MTRATVRQREFAVRAALGADRRRIIRQLIAESLALAIVGGVLGLAIGAAILRVAPSLMPEALLPTVLTLTIDARVAAFCAVMVLIVGLLFGIAPAWHASSLSAAQAMSGTRTATGRGGRVREWLVAGQVAVVTVLLVRRRPAAAHAAGRRGCRPRLRRRSGAQHGGRPDVGHLPHRRGGAAVLRSRGAGDPRVARRAGRRVGDHTAARRVVRGHGVLRDRRASRRRPRVSAPGPTCRLSVPAISRPWACPSSRDDPSTHAIPPGAHPSASSTRRSCAGTCPAVPRLAGAWSSASPTRRRPWPSCARSWAWRDRSRGHPPRPRTCSRSMCRWRRTRLATSSCS